MWATDKDRGMTSSVIPAIESSPDNSQLHHHRHRTPSSISVSHRQIHSRFHHHPRHRSHLPPPPHQQKQYDDDVYHIHHHHPSRMMRPPAFSTTPVSRPLPTGLARSVWTKTLTFLLFFLYLSSHLGGIVGVAALSCAACDLDLCPSTDDCQGGLVIDICGCCQVCAKTKNQSCGGPFGIRGKCDRNLQCFIRPEIGKPITGSEEGICKVVKELQCNGSHCPPVFEQLLCPRDSNLVTFPNDVLVFSNIHRPTNDSHNSTKDSTSHGEDRSEVVPDRTSYCVCNKTRCGSTVCAPGFTAVIVQNATGFPGSCCDIITCDQTKGCDPVICPPLDQTPCPDDSIRLPSIWMEDKCCEIQQGYMFVSLQRQMPTCGVPVGFQVQIIARATGVPGSCCDKFRCVNESGLTCRYGDKEMKNGEKLKVDKCRTCVCKDGLSKCRDKTCSRLSCLWIVIPDDECCPICRGCVSDSGNLYNNSEVWKENDCTTCKCVEGLVQCQAETCATHCANPVRIPGQCCLSCPEETTTSTSTSLAPQICPSLDSCSLECPDGLELSPFGCYVCKCKKEKCLLNCSYGLKTDFEGNSLCECKGPEILCPPWEENQCDMKCEYGYKRSQDGCIKCKCNRCPPVNCTKRCLHGLMFNDEGCRICRCKEEAVPELMGPEVDLDLETTEDIMSCMSHYGARHENGESWNDGCRVCYCHKGVEMCSLIACPAPHCSNPVFKIGDCCPSCPGLTIPSPNGEKVLCQSTLGEYYVEGQTWKMDHCTRCVCHGGNILCETMSCRPVLCHHPIKLENQCCPICKGGDLGLLPASPLRRRCKAPTGMLYKHREVWRSSPCQTCVCQDGQFHCYHQMCAPIKCNKTLLRKDQCCPTCADPETSEPKICSYNGDLYDSEEKWQGDNCTQCMCLAGRVHCFPLTCPSLKCSVMVSKRGQCCPQCYEMPSHGKELEEKHQNTTVPVSRGSRKSHEHYISIIILSFFLIVFACIIGYLSYRLYLRRKKHSLRDVCALSSDELHGTPFIQPKDNEITFKEPHKEKLFTNLEEKGNADRAFNNYSDLPFPDENKNKTRSS